jgi:hypothetical protein
MRLDQSLYRFTMQEQQLISLMEPQLYFIAVDVCCIV